jgi:hypothetical protein
LLIVAALRELGLVASIDIGEKVGAVVGNGLERQLKLGDKPLGQFALGGGDLRFLDQIEVIPERLAGKLTEVSGDESGERGIAIPVGEAEFAGGADRPVDGGEKQILAHGKALSAFGEMAVEKFDQTDLLGEIVECDNVAKSGDIHGSRLRCEGFLVAEGSLNEIVRGSQVDSTDDLGLAPNALAFAEVVVGVAFNDFGGKACHRNPG